MNIVNIPYTVAEELISLMRLNINIFNVHASGEFTMVIAQQKYCKKCVVNAVKAVIRSNQTIGLKEL